MNESPSDVWFFSRDGHQSGPITFAELKEKADEGALRPRHDLAWCAGMPEWKPVGEIEGLFERRVPTTTNVSQPMAADSQTAETNTWPTQEVAAEEEWPGTRRFGFLFVLLIFPILWTVAFEFAKPFFEAQFGKNLPSDAITAIGFIPVLVAFWTNLQRLANLGMSRLWILGYLIPFLGFWVLYRSVACPAGYAHHKKMDGVGIFLAIVYWLVIAAIIACSVVLLLAMFGMLGDPAIQENLKSAFEQFKAKAAVPAQ